ncbi:amino acid adenylation domain-containing protein [Roseivirga sp. BDSF3-8]|uniref:non-ribosomal peptide synthetase n=1 Tax=Roseivirga sp. BDSF3-8 TaxID=3241598 RepID=UPI0035320906
MSTEIEKKKEQLRQLLMLKAQQAKKPFGLSQGQKSLLFLQMSQKDRVDYNSGFAIRIEGALDVELFGTCVKELGQRHGILRTIFSSDKDKEYQQTGDQPLTLEVVDCPGASEEELDRLVTERLQTPFDLENGPVARPALFRISESEHVFLFALHHIIYDEWTSRILLMDLTTLYQRRLNDPAFKLPPVKNTFAEYVSWQEQQMEKPELVNFWQNYLENHEEAQLELNGDQLIQAHELNASGEVIQLPINEKLMSGLRQLCAAQGATMFNMMISLFEVALSRYAGQEEIMIGTPVAGRNNPDFHQTAGYFVNLIPMRTRVEGEERFSDFLKKNVENNRRVLAHQDFPFNKMVEMTSRQRSTARHPLFNIAFTYYNQKRLKDELRQSVNIIDGLQLSEYEIRQQEDAYDITFEVKEMEHSGQVKFKYRTARYTAPYMEGFASYLLGLVEKVVANPDQSVSDLAAFNPEVHALASGPDRELGGAQTVYDAFRKTAGQNGSSMALRHGNTSLSYAQLAEHTERLTAALQQKLGSEKHVGLLAGTGFPMIQGMLSLLALGKAYVPLKTDLPASRQAWMLENAGASVVLCDRAHKERAESLGENLTALCIEDLLETETPGFEAPAIQPEDTAYLMYTSGSTGTPKGVTVAHRSILNLVQQQEEMQINAGDRVPQLSNYSFDGSIYDIFGSLLNGATLHLIDQEVIGSADSLLRYFSEHQINKGFFTTALFNSLVDLDAARYLSTFDRVLFGGEQVSVKHVSQALRQAKPHTLLHVYGPTETTTYATAYPIKERDTASRTIPIGRPLAGVHVSIRMQDLQPAPVGVTGEICISGAGLSKGYLGHPELTEEKFVTDSHGTTLYKTGDYGYMLPAGEIVFAGRKDHQVKMRGFRIELGEIEAALYRMEGVKKAIVLVENENTDRSRLLAAVEGDTTSLKEEDIRTSLAENLPDYMLPARILVFDNMALNKNAKIDRNLLWEAIRQQLSGESREKVVPATPEETAVAAIWKEVLGTENIGVTDSFFELGGNSLLAMRVLSRIKHDKAIELSPNELFDSPTIRGLCEVMAKKKPAAPGGPSRIRRSNRDQFLLKK